MSLEELNAQEVHETEGGFWEGLAATLVAYVIISSVEYPSQFMDGLTGKPLKNKKMNILEINLKELTKNEILSVNGGEAVSAIGAWIGGDFVRYAIGGPFVLTYDIFNWTKS